MGLGTHRVVVVAGWDPSGGGGLIRDLQTLHALGVPASAVMAAITTQNARARGRVEPVSSAVVLDQLRSSAPSPRRVVLKIGMLYSRANIEALTRWIEREHPKAVVVDPVLESKGGLKLATRDALAAYPALIRRSTVVTPNLSEAHALLASTQSRPTLGPHVAALLLHRMGAKHVLLKLPATSRNKTDLHFDGTRFTKFENRRPAPFEVRGSGCTLASALAAFLARGFPPSRAIPRALRYVRNEFSKSRAVGRVRFFS